MLIALPEFLEVIRIFCELLITNGTYIFYAVAVREMKKAMIVTTNHR